MADRPRYQVGDIVYVVKAAAEVKEFQAVTIAQINKSGTIRVDCTLHVTSGEVAQLLRENRRNTMFKEPLPRPGYLQEELAPLTNRYFRSSSPELWLFPSERRKSPKVSPWMQKLARRIQADSKAYPLPTRWPELQALVPSKISGVEAPPRAEDFWEPTEVKVDPLLQVKLGAGAAFRRTEVTLLYINSEAARPYQEPILLEAPPDAKEAGSKAGPVLTYARIIELEEIIKRPGLLEVSYNPLAVTSEAATLKEVPFPGESKMPLSQLHLIGRAINAYRAGRSLFLGGLGVVGRQIVNQISKDWLIGYTRTRFKEYEVFGAPNQPQIWVADSILAEVPPGTVWVKPS